MDALLEEPISVVSVGRDSMRRLFMRVWAAVVGDRNQIWHGGARLKRYGMGFALNYYDVTSDGRKLATYVSSAEVAAYRYRGMLLDVLEQAKERRYVTAFVWGEIAADLKDEKAATLKPSSLKHL